jgi:hypothetical protein
MSETIPISSRIPATNISTTSAERGTPAFRGQRGHRIKALAQAWAINIAAKEQ